MNDFMSVLAEITAKSLADLTEGDIAFMKARQSYLTDEQKEAFASVLSTETKEEKKTKTKK